MNFSEALRAIQDGEKMQRSGWNGKGMFVFVVRGSNPAEISGDYSVNSIVWPGECLPFIAMKTADNKLVPWLASQTDLLANDWQSFVE
ncbi:MAG: DUF2829 domain-containing protein [Candidatus Omnitrophota bacterium]